VAIHTFAYTDCPIDPSPAFPEGTISRRPVLRVTLVNGTLRVPLLALVDSMSDFTVLPKSAVVALGVDTSAALSANLVGVGAQPASLFQHFDIEVEDFLQTNILAGFTESLEGWASSF
jgi:hypothetical protein